MDARQPTRFQYAHQFRGKVIHLLKELVVTLIVPEIVIGRRVLIVIGKRNTCYYQVY